MRSRDRVAERFEPNLTPILDMVFQLITFFMLVINFQAASVDLSLKLPVVGSARPVGAGDAADRLVLNVDTEGRMSAFGKEVSPEEFLSREARSARELARLQGRPLGADDPLPTTVVIRADRAATFSQVNRVLRACQQEGYLRFSLMVMTGGEATR